MKWKISIGKKPSRPSLPALPPPLLQSLLTPRSSLPKVPKAPSSPRVLLNTVLGSIVGLALAIAAALGLEALDRRVRLASDVVDALGLPIIGTIPGPSHRLRLRRSDDADMQHRLLAPAAAPAKGA